MNQTSSLLNAVKVVSAAAGLFMVAMGLVAGMAYLLQLILSPGEAGLDSAVASLSFAALGIGLGGALAWQSVRSLLGYISAAFRPVPVWWLILGYIVTVATGQLIIYFDFFPTVIFFPFHILAAAIPPFAILVYVSRAINPTNPDERAVILRWRDMIVNLSGGAFLATTFAFIAEIFIGLIMLLLAAVMIALTPDGREFLETLAANVQDPFWAQDPANIQEVLLYPPLAISLAVVFVILAPAVEELLKPISVFLMSYRRPSPAQIFGWGLAAGAGFALIENLFNTVLALDAWIVVMLLRLGGTLMHCLGSGLMGLGWQHMLTSRRPWRLAGAYLLAVTIHAMWNGAVIGITGLSLVAADATGEIILGIIGTVIIIMVGVLIALGAGLLVALILIAKRLR